jgi:hypothetical protein
MDFIKEIFTKSTSEPIEDLLVNEDDTKTQAWQDAKIQELGYVGITVRAD